MILDKKIAMGAGWVQKRKYEYQGTQYEADIKNGDVVDIINDGAKVMGQYGEQNAFKIKTRNGEKVIALNAVSQNNLIDAYGKDTKKWIGQKAKVWLVKAMVGGKMQTIAYLAHPDAEFDEDDGSFSGIGDVDDDGQDLGVDDDDEEVPEDLENL